MIVTVRSWKISKESNIEKNTHNSIFLSIFSLYELMSSSRSTCLPMITSENKVLTIIANNSYEIDPFSDHQLFFRIRQSKILAQRVKQIAPSLYLAMKFAFFKLFLPFFSPRSQL